jgi:bifunctional DNase/RNase
VPFKKVYSKDKIYFFFFVESYMSLILLSIKGISYSQTQSGAYALVLSEMEGARTLPIIIGAFEAQSIAIALETEIRPPRPLTHDLFKTFSDRFEIHIKEVIIHKLVDGVFFSSLVCEKDGVEEVIDTRTSDAIAIAVRFNAPIYAYENILDKAGIYLKVEEEMELENKQESTEISIELEEIITQDDNSFSSLSLKELHNQLNNAVEDENYEVAAKIRDEISNRS